MKSMFKTVSTAIALGMLTFALHAPATEAMDESALSTADALQLEVVEAEDAAGGFSHDFDHHGSRFVCYARNLRGMMFRAVGRYPQRAQQRAVDNCYEAGSRYCYAAGCSRMR